MNAITTQSTLSQSKQRYWFPRWEYWSPYRFLLIGGASLTAVLILLVPIYLLVRMGGAWAEAAETLSKPRTLAVLGNTVKLAAAVTLSSAAIAVPIAWLTMRTDLPGRRLWGVLTALPLVVPSYVFAYLYVTILSPKGLLQQLLEPLGVLRLAPIYGFPGAFLVLTLISVSTKNAPGKP